MVRLGKVIATRWDTAAERNYYALRGWANGVVRAQYLGCSLQHRRLAISWPKSAYKTPHRDACRAVPPAAAFIIFPSDKMLSAVAIYLLVSYLRGGGGFANEGSD